MMIRNTINASLIMKQNEIDFSLCPCCYWKPETKITYLQRYLLLHSILYYKRSESVISDTKFDAVAKQLYRAQANAKTSVLEKTMYYYATVDFNGSTMYDVMQLLTHDDYSYLEQIALRVLKMYNEERQEKHGKQQTRKTVKSKRG